MLLSFYSMKEIDINSLAQEIKTDRQPRSITPRQLFNAFGFERRTSGNCFWVDKFLNENSLWTNPHYNDVWVDEVIMLEHKPVATTQIQEDPIRRINTLDSANTIPLYVNNSDSLFRATTLMQYNDFSQLPVVNNGPRSLVGYISWESIAKRKINGATSDQVKDYVEHDIKILRLDTPLIQAIEVIKENDFAVVLAKDNSLCGIVTASDVTSQYFEETQPFALLRELECHLRNLLRDKILVEELQKICCTNDRKLFSIDEMTFGDYVTVFGNENLWNKVNIAADRKTFISMLEDVRIIRNEVMHFRPAGVSEGKSEKLKRIVEYLWSLTNFQRGE